MLLAWIYCGVFISLAIWYLTEYYGTADTHEDWSSYINEFILFTVVTVIMWPIVVFNLIRALMRSDEDDDDFEK